MQKKQGLIEAVEDFQASYPLQFHLPSHSGRYINESFKDLVVKYGVKKIDGCWLAMHNVEGLEFPGARLGDLGDIYHKPFGSQLTLFLQNGSTIGNQIVSLCLAKKKVLIQTNSHISVYSGLQLAGATIIPLQPEYNAEYDLYMPVTAHQIKEALENDPEIGAIYLTSPNMEGLVANYQEIRQACKDVLMIVDEAHGAHCYFSKLMPTGALKSGADATVNSVHKTLGALSASALINVSKSSRLPAQKVKDSYHLLNTTSPSPLLLADVESCVRIFKQEGEQLLEGAINLNKKFKAALQRMPQVIIGNFDDQYESDPTKTVFKIKGLSGHDVGDLLDLMRINIEKTTQKCCVVTCHINITEQDIDELIAGVEQIAREHGVVDDIREDHQQLNPIYKRILIARKITVDLRDVLASESDYLPADQCLGKISAEIKYVCPPGFPVLVYGEEILQEHIEYFGQQKIKVLRND
ncbi:arginine decarboxylase [Stylonychia lemnae]|uniref:Arginine decarboxylase n=1 Tax=Stylonychia lemnae TaxID=5949 RepID=A0A077ZZG6_STYLE|nr:arginine decarboxylase [Stylonychia lemnae]|eukprot:CDW73898.1 arginine decarboxylase [Stylonychia lemnae]